ncbi:hypothetical protein RR46_01878 [Papilio xuthus]|uniref:Uncharacterized protein n=1 Tax=Papilio xuthus TaxID=66420 RepID=A0A194QKE1_PAPXU|nr:hypothetical protein RR46_01878 [Papilio xuthus]
MWWRFLAFCVLVSLVLFILISCIYGRPVVHLSLNRCCDNDQIAFENFGDNVLSERYIKSDSLGMENSTIIALDNIEKMIDNIRQLVNVHNPSTRDLYDELVEELVSSNAEDGFLDSSTEVTNIL